MEGGDKRSFRQIYQQGAWILTSHSRESIPGRVTGKEVLDEEAGLVNTCSVYKTKGEELSISFFSIFFLEL